MLKFFKIFIITILIIFKHSPGQAENTKLKIGLLVPMTGENNKLGNLLIKSTRLALNDIGTDKIEIYPRDTANDPNKTLELNIKTIPKRKIKKEMSKVNLFN